MCFVISTFKIFICCASVRPCHVNTMKRIQVTCSHNSVRTQLCSLEFIHRTSSTCECVCVCVRARDAMGQTDTDGFPVLTVCLLKFNNRNPKVCRLFEAGTKQRLITAVRAFSDSSSLTEAIHSASIRLHRSHHWRNLIPRLLGATSEL
jgi:hypothetical protein